MQTQTRHQTRDGKSAARNASTRNGSATTNTTNTTNTTKPTKTTNSKAAAPSLDELAQKTSAELEALFASAKTFALKELQGDPRGRALAVPRFDQGVAAAMLRRWSKSPYLPWEGKSFSWKSGSSEGAGINRVRLLKRRRALFAFRTYKTESRVDGQPCVAIDYDVETNPKGVRPLYDELRALGDGVYLGRGMRRRTSDAESDAKSTKKGKKSKKSDEPALLIWFALDARTPDAKVEWDGYRPSSAT